MSLGGVVKKISYEFDVESTVIGIYDAFFRYIKTTSKIISGPNKFGFTFRNDPKGFSSPMFFLSVNLIVGIILENIQNHSKGTLNANLIDPMILRRVFEVSRYFIGYLVFLMIFQFTFIISKGQRTISNFKSMNAAAYSSVVFIPYELISMPFVNAKTDNGLFRELFYLFSSHNISASSLFNLIAHAFNSISIPYIIDILFVFYWCYLFKSQIDSDGKSKSLSRLLCSYLILIFLNISIFISIFSLKLIPPFERYLKEVKDVGVEVSKKDPNWSYVYWETKDLMDSKNDVDGRFGINMALLNTVSCIHIFEPKNLQELTCLKSSSNNFSVEEYSDRYFCLKSYFNSLAKSKTIDDIELMSFAKDSFEKLDEYFSLFIQQEANNRYLYGSNYTNTWSQDYKVNMTVMTEYFSFLSLFPQPFIKSNILEDLIPENS